VLAKETNAAIVEHCLLHGDAERYALAAWCVMPTHVHSWKSFSAHEINRLENRTGPVTAKLVERPEEWQFSSANWRRS
jgi:hypothetical protein